MSSLILLTAVRYLMPLLLLFSLYMLLRGHNEPGGGFVGGLVAAAAFCLAVMAGGVAEARSTLRFEPRTLIAFGLLIAALSGALPLVAGQPLMTGLWTTREIPVLGKIGTPQSFDIGVYLTVLGVVLAIVFSLADEEEK